MDSSKMSSACWFWLFFTFSFIGTFQHAGIGVYGYRQCPKERGGGVCPDYATCCPTNTPGVSSCITNKNTNPQDPGDCCSIEDNNDEDGASIFTGCGYGFQCASNTTVTAKGDNETVKYCQRRSNARRDVFPQCQQLPRYELCSIPKDRHDILQQVYGFPVKEQSSNSDFQLAYYSNMNSITVPNTQHLHVETVWIVIHGSGRNPDDYLCCAMSSIPSSTAASLSMLIVSPWFAAPEDGPINITALAPNNTEHVLRWSDPGPMRHTWRYGADSIHGNISAFETVDTLVEYLAKAQVQFPKLRNIIVAGHSAGGQFVHRWALLSNSPVWGDTSDSTAESNSYSTPDAHATTKVVRSLPIRVIAANPRSYCYMDERRIVNGTFQKPEPGVVASCTIYNTWQWGLDDDDGHGDRGMLEPVAYRDRALAHTPRERLVNRYATRDVYYLLGEYDTLTLKDHCTTEKFQGMTRNERGKNYYQALQGYFSDRDGHSGEGGNARDDLLRPKFVHVQLEAAQSPHDHCLMFQSPEGQEALGFSSRTIDAQDMGTSG